MTELATASGDQRHESRPNGSAKKQTNGAATRVDHVRLAATEPVTAAPPLSAEPDSYSALRQGLVEHLTMLRAEFREAIANYSIHVQGLLTQLEDALADQPAELSDAERERRERTLRQVLKDAEALNLKPVKGRRRDLKKVEDFADRLNDLIDEW